MIGTIIQSGLFSTSLIHYKLFLLVGGFVLAKAYWGLSDEGYFSAPLFFLQIGLIWSLFYFITVAPEYKLFVSIYNRFADLAYFFIIGCSIYRIRAIKKLQLEKDLSIVTEDDLEQFHEELAPQRFPFHEYAENIKE